MSSIQPANLCDDGWLSSLALGLGRLNLVGQAIVVSMVVAGVGVLLGTAGWMRSGSAGLLAASVAAGVCLVGAWLALVLGKPWQGPTAPMYGMLAGMLVRMFVALPLGVVLQLQVPALADASMIVYLLICYMATLAVETTLLVARVHAQAFEPGSV